MNNFIELLVWGRRSRLFQRQKHLKLTINEDTWQRLKDDLYKHLPNDEAKLALAIVRYHEQFMSVK
jgi:hypothetical protein